MRIELSDFAYVERPNKMTGKALRFTIAQSFDVGNGQMAETSQEGNLAYYRWNGEFVWQPPLTRKANSRFPQQIHYMNMVYYNLIRDELLDNKDILKYLDTPESINMRKARKLMIREVDATLPEVLEPKVYRDREKENGI